MNRYFQFLVIALVLLLAGQATAQKRKTIILIRHAEKDTSEFTDQMNPSLSAAGKERSERLVKRIGKFRPGAIYSTDYKRTRETVEPLAKKRGKPIQIYDASKPRDLIDAIMKSEIKRFVIVGHSNTIPPLANLLTGKELFKNLEDAEHSVIWIIRIRGGKTPEVNILDY
jgi:2,3-bisphosphoglycerate-dependent phosphoglycerate mutase